VATNPVRFTADDVFDLPVPPHLRGYELVDGQLVEVSAATLPHGRMIAEISRRLLNFLDANDVRGGVYADGGYVLGLPQDRERLRAPDVSFVTQATLARYGGEPERGFARFVPDFAIEVDSPNRRPRVEHQRIQDYLDAGVRLLWVIHTTTRSATVYRADGSAQLLRQGETLDGEDLLPGLRIPLSEIV
jgi:Uma2 family endonuclease